jgi:hypothetical protein
MKKVFIPLLLIFAASIAVWAFYKQQSRLLLSTPEILGGVMRTEDAGVDRLYYLTSQWEKRSIFRSSRVTSSIKTINWLNVDLWEFDSTTAQPLSRRRIKREKVNADAKALGVEEGVLWARIPELVGIRLADGMIVVDREKITARNPALAGLLPRPPATAFFLTESMQPLKFDPGVGMIVRLDDAREVRIDPLTLEATPYVAQDPENKPSPEATAPSSRMKGISPSSGTDWYAMVRGLSVPQAGVTKEWIGLLTETDLKMMQETKLISWQMDFTKPQRSRLFRATLEGGDGKPGAAMWYHQPSVLPESPDFLMAGLLIEEASQSRNPTALWRREPDSVFVISSDRLGEEGRLQMARVSSEKGAPIWSATLPLSQLNAWIPGNSHALIMGPAPSEKRSPMAQENENPVMHLLSIDLLTGSWQSFNPDLHRDWPVEESSLKAK